MSVDPAQPPSADPASAKPPADPVIESLETLPQKRRFRKGSDPDADEGDRPDQTIQLLSALLQDLIARRDQTAPADHEAKTAKYHRLSKTGSGNPTPSSETAVPAVSAPPPTRPPETGRAAETPAVPPVPPVTFRPAPYYESRFKSIWVYVPLLGLLLIVGVANLAVFYLKAPTASPGRGSKTDAPSAPAAVWTDAMLTQLDQALAADQAGDLKGAQRLAAALVRPDVPPPPGLDRYLTSLGTRQDRFYDVEADLLRAITNAAPDRGALLNERLAFNFSRARDFQKAADFLKTSTQLDPFSAPSYYHLGEVLRHLGHFQDAVSTFRRALDRVPTGQPEFQSLRECINLKLCLALLEQGRENEFQSELDAQLKTPVPSGYWLLVGAAVALQHKNLAEAAADLGRARDALGPAQFEALLNDYFFRAYADRKELENFFPPDPAERRAKLLPTMTYTVEP